MTHLAPRANAHARRHTEDAAVVLALRPALVDHRYVVPDFTQERKPHRRVIPTQLTRLIARPGHPDCASHAGGSYIPDVAWLGRVGNVGEEEGGRERERSRLSGRLALGKSCL